MAVQSHIQLVRGATATAAAYTPLIAEPIYDIGKKTLRIGDGTTAGGTVLAKEAIKLKTDTEALLKFNAAAEADHSADISVTVDKAALAAKLVSTKANNALQVASATGEDNLLYIEAQDTDALVATGEKVIFVKTESGVKKLATNLQFAYDNVTGKLTVKGGSTGTDQIAELTIPTSLTLLKTAEVVTDPSGQPQGTYLHFVFATQAGAGHDTADVYVNVTSFIDTYTAGDGLTTAAGDSKKFMINLAGTGNQAKLDGVTKQLIVPTDFGTLD